MSWRAKLLGVNGKERVGTKKWMRWEHNERMYSCSDEVVGNLEDYIWTRPSFK